MWIGVRCVGLRVRGKRGVGGISAAITAPTARQAATRQLLATFREGAPAGLAVGHGLVDRQWRLNHLVLADLYWRKK